MVIGYNYAYKQQLPFIVKVISMVKYDYRLGGKEMKELERKRTINKTFFLFEVMRGRCWQAGPVIFGETTCRKN